MQGHRLPLAIIPLLTAVFWPAVASAQQAATAEELLALDRGDLRNEIEARYDASLALSRDGGVVGADDNRFTWASQATAQCGIAVGFLKAGIKDPVSVGKCVEAYNRLQQPAAPAAPAPAAPAPAAAICSEPVAGIVFFDWGSDVLPESAAPTLDAVAAAQRQCGWTRLEVAGHTDRSGPDAYNIGLSQRRAAAVAGALEGKGVGSSVLQVTGHGESQPKVPTADGERNPTNRRVEITVK